MYFFTDFVQIISHDAVVFHAVLLSDVSVITLSDKECPISFFITQIQSLPSNLIIQKNFFDVNAKMLSKVLTSYKVYIKFMLQ